ncbi:MAG: hypothetical protein ACLUD2_12800 [Clostridium sp.]
MPGGGQESNVIRTYIETLLELPWNKISKDNQRYQACKADPGRRTIMVSSR